MAGRRGGSTATTRQQINAALSFAMRSKKPTLIACRTIIGLGAPTKAGTAATHGSPLGAQEAAAAKAALGWHEPPFTVPDDLLRAMACRRQPRRRHPPRLAEAPRPQRRCSAEFERVMAGRLPDSLARGGRGAEAGDRRDQAEDGHPRQSSQKALEALVPAMPELVGGSADLTGSNLTFVKGMGAVERRQLRRALHPLRRARARHGARP